MTTRKKLVNQRNETGAPDAPPKKTYTTPRLTVYGSIEKLTKTGGATVRDKGQQKRH